jgi:hypothetical protein
MIDDFQFSYWDIKKYDDEFKDLTPREHRGYKLFHQGWLGVCIHNISRYEYDMLKVFAANKEVHLEDVVELADTLDGKQYSVYSSTIWFKNHELYELGKDVMDAFPKRIHKFISETEIVLPEGLSADFNFTMAEFRTRHNSKIDYVVLTCSHNEIDLVEIKLLNDNLENLL